MQELLCRRLRHNDRYFIEKWWTKSRRTTECTACPVFAECTLRVDGRIVSKDTFLQVKGGSAQSGSAFVLRLKGKMKYFFMPDPALRRRFVHEKQKCCTFMEAVYGLLSENYEKKFRNYGFFVLNMLKYR